MDRFRELLPFLLTIVAASALVIFLFPRHDADGGIALSQTSEEILG